MQYIYARWDESSPEAVVIHQIEDAWFVVYNPTKMAHLPMWLQEYAGNQAFSAITPAPPGVPAMIPAQAEVIDLISARARIHAVKSDTGS